MVTARKYNLHFHTIMVSFHSKIHYVYMEKRTMTNENNIEIPLNIEG